MQTRLIRAPELALIAVTAVWGMTFVAVDWAMTHSGPLLFTGVRFAIAALATGLLAARSLAGLTGAELRAGIAIGASIAAGYGLQTSGLAAIGPSRSAFITALYVPLVPVMQWLFLRRRPGWPAWAGVALAFAGLALVAGPGAAQAGFGRGEALTLACAVAVAAEIILIGGFAGSVDSRRVTVVQLAVASVLSLIGAAVTGESVPAPSLPLAGLVVTLGLASAAIQQTMNWAQRSVSPARATVIYAGEPVWSALFARLAGERLPVITALGGALIVAGVLVSEFAPRRRSGEAAV